MKTQKENEKIILNKRFYIIDYIILIITLPLMLTILGIASLKDKIKEMIK